jgi:hypothetical protein
MLNPGDTLFGTTLVQGDVPQSAAAAALMRWFNAWGDSAQPSRHARSTGGGPRAAFQGCARRAGWLCGCVFGTDLTVASLASRRTRLPQYSYRDDWSPRNLLPAARRRPGSVYRMNPIRVKVLILGGYGTFGGRLAQLLASDAGVTLLIGGRSLAQAQTFCDRLAPGAWRLPKCAALRSRRRCACTDPSRQPQPSGRCKSRISMIYFTSYSMMRTA